MTQVPMTMITEAIPFLLKDGFVFTDDTDDIVDMNESQRVTRKTWAKSEADGTETGGKKCKSGERAIINMYAGPGRRRGGRSSVKMECKLDAALEYRWVAKDLYYIITTINKAKTRLPKEKLNLVKQLLSSIENHGI
jgi:hypothetical protein